MVCPLSASLRNNSIILRSRPGSRPEVGSSRKKTLGFASSARATHQGHKLARRDGDGDIVNQNSLFRANLFEIQRINAHTAALVLLRQLCAGEGQLIRTDTNLVTGSKPMLVDALSIDKDVV